MYCLIFNRDFFISALANSIQFRYAFSFKMNALSNWLGGCILLNWLLCTIAEYFYWLLLQARKAGWNTYGNWNL